MPQHAEAFPQGALQPKPEEEPEKKSAEILPFRRYEEYKGLGGILNPEEYKYVLKLAKEGKKAPSGSLSSEAANSMARFAEVNLSPEIITLYEILSEERPGLAKERGKGLPDQELLVEALCIIGNESSLVKFKERLRLKKDLLQEFFIKNKTAK